jgi:CDP-glucose 4,6-dehydratase
MGMTASSFWRDRPTLVTGATGLVGGWVVEQLLSLDADVICVVRDWVPQSQLLSSEELSRVKLVRGDVRDQALMERTLNEYDIDTVIHLAAQTTVVAANRNPVSTFETNIGGTWTTLEACRRCPSVKQVVIASSDKAYGDHDALPYTEGTALVGRHPYDVSKSCADLIAQSYALTYELPVAVTRCGNFYGGGDLNWNRLIPGTIRSLYNQERPIIRSNGQYVRDYFHAKDGALAYLLLAQKLAENSALRGEAFNFSTEEPLTVLQVVERIREAMGSRLEVEVKNIATNEILDQSLSAAKARAVLGWQPRFQLSEGLAGTIEWYRNYFEKNYGTRA